MARNCILLTMPAELFLSSSFPSFHSYIHIHFLLLSYHPSSSSFFLALALRTLHTTITVHSFFPPCITITTIIIFHRHRHFSLLSSSPHDIESLFPPLPLRAVSLNSSLHSFHLFRNCLLHLFRFSRAEVSESGMK